MKKVAHRGMLLPIASLLQERREVDLCFSGRGSEMRIANLVIGGCATPSPIFSKKDARSICCRVNGWGSICLSRFGLNSLVSPGSISLQTGGICNANPVRCLQNPLLGDLEHKSRARFGLWTWLWLFPGQSH